jgi:protein-disulfide isomerase
MSRLGTAAAAALLLCLPLSAGRAQDANPEIEVIIKQYLTAHPDLVSEMIKDYVIKHPDFFKDILADSLKQQPAAVATAGVNPNPNALPDHGEAVKKNAAALFSSPHQVTLGKPDGDITLVEFFDYNCGFCKGAMPVLLSLLDDDPKLKVVLKEWPILGPGSVEAAHIAVAVRMQDIDGQKYLAFHRKLLGDPGPINKHKALAAAAAAGCDVPRLEHDMDSDEVRATLAEDNELARAIGINGTPGYVVGTTVVPGAVGLAALKDQISNARVRAN